MSIRYVYVTNAKLIRVARKVNFKLDTRRNNVNFFK